MKEIYTNKILLSYIKQDDFASIAIFRVAASLKSELFFYSAFQCTRHHFIRLHYAHHC